MSGYAMARILELEQELEEIRASLGKLRLMHQEFVSSTARGERDSIIRFLESLLSESRRHGDERAQSVLEYAIRGVKACVDQR